MIELRLTKEEARLVALALKGRVGLMDDVRNREDRRRMEALIIRLEAEIKIERLKR